MKLSLAIFSLSIAVVLLSISLVTTIQINQISVISIKQGNYVEGIALYRENLISNGEISSGKFSTTVSDGYFSLPYGGNLSLSYNGQNVKVPLNHGMGIIISKDFIQAYNITNGTILVSTMGANPQLYILSNYSTLKFKQISDETTSCEIIKGAKLNIISISLKDNYASVNGIDIRLKSALPPTLEGLANILVISLPIFDFLIITSPRTYKSFSDPLVLSILIIISIMFPLLILFVPFSYILLTMFIIFNVQLILLFSILTEKFKLLILFISYSIIIIHSITLIHLPLILFESPLIYGLTLIPFFIYLVPPAYDNPLFLFILAIIWTLLYYLYAYLNKIKDSLS
ncbi:hypothetical protein [Sulfuracidifex metallicus]|uniref:hypothetical protein n=1 Tax=Sulfuracidifex metallicus TaxID=47303 RepID=UPI0022759086|nr:hypothetical protein [Sulfuracidifex metallicus]MCY0850384.1 hypothetical protein [Sulfuracidifex metallicus]